MSKIQTALKEGLSACKEIFERDYFGNHTVKLSDFDPIKKRFERAEQEESKLRTDNDALKRRNEWLESEVTHWKANHADLKERLYVATHRTDLPSDRFPIFEQLKAENKKLRIIMMSASKKLNSSEDCSNLPQQLRDAALCNDISYGFPLTSLKLVSGYKVEKTTDTSQTSESTVETKTEEPLSNLDDVFKKFASDLGSCT